MDKKLTEIKEKIFAEQRLNVEDALLLYQSDDLLSIAELAYLVKQKHHSNKIYYIINQHIDYSNICLLRCPLCAFSRSAEDADAFFLTPDDLLTKIDKNVNELHIVGGINKNANLNYFVSTFKKIKTAFPHISIKALTPVEIDFLANEEKLDVKQVLTLLKESGLNTMPGGGAEIFSPRVRNIICPNKISGTRWLEIMEEAHSLGIPTNATMLCGHGETLEERVQHLNHLRILQDTTHGFLAFVPLAFHPRHTKLNYFKDTTGYDDLKTIAISRLFLDNFPHIKAYWIMLSPKLAQISFFFGADDIDGTIKEELIFHAAGSTTIPFLTESQIVTLIKEANQLPVRRDSFYQ